DYITAEIAESCHNGGGYVSDVGNGYCYELNNIEECDYDGGDCCECTCGDESGDLDDFSCTDFACVDPNAPCVDDITDDTFEDCLNFGDGFCNDYNNNEQCGYDGGDCCECTCVVSTSWSTESGCTEFACIDPMAPCADDDDITADAVESCIIEYLGDGICDASNNFEICGYDGGDCCECTCGYDSTDVLDESNCSNFACVDPTASCFDESITVDMFENCDAELLGDGYCQESNNNEICDYDFGDCCEYTCGVDSSESLDEFACSSFACIDPRLATQSPTPAPLSSECFEDPSCEDGAGGQSVDVPGTLESATNQGFIVAGIVTVLNLFYLTCCRKDKGADEVHCYLLLMAYVFSVAEGICVILLVPNSKENFKIGAVFLFGAVAALSGFLLRKAGRHVIFAFVNAVLEGSFAASVLFYFVEQSTRNIFLFGAIAGNEALVGFAIAARVNSRPNSNEDSLETSFEIGVLIGEAVGDVIFPLVATLIQSLFHRDSAWRSDFVFTWWAITGFANTSAICMCLVPPVNRIAFGPKLALLTQFFFNGSTGVMAFVILTLTEINIADPPTFDIVWSSVAGTLGVL
ncbi:unnamed protein product, partial [Ectocarpus sp. 4 AP-2014]